MTAEPVKRILLHGMRWLFAGFLGGATRFHSKSKPDNPRCGELHSRTFNVVNLWRYGSEFQGEHTGASSWHTRSLHFSPPLRGLRHTLIPQELTTFACRLKCMASTKLSREQGLTPEGLKAEREPPQAYSLAEEIHDAP